MERANGAPVGRASALEAMHAAALSILLSCPMRVKNLASLDLDRHLKPRLSGTHTIYGIRIEGTEVKAGEPIEVVLSAKMSRLIHRYVTQFRPQLSELAGTALFLVRPTASHVRPQICQVRSSLASSARPAWPCMFTCSDIWPPCFT